MKGKTKKIVLAVAVIGAIAAGGVAFTAANTVPDSVAGYATTTVSGATVTDVQYGLNSVGDTINTVTLTFSSPDITNLHVKIGFNGNATTDCTSTSATAGHLQRPHRGPRGRDRPRRGGHRHPVVRIGSALGDGRAPARSSPSRADRTIPPFPPS